MEVFGLILEKFDQARVVILGDLIIDQYIWGKVSRISPEAPIPRWRRLPNWTLPQSLRRQTELLLPSSLSCPFTFEVGDDWVFGFVFPLNYSSGPPSLIR